MATISMKALLEAGVHFGHQTRRWNPKMSKYIFGSDKKNSPPLAGHITNKFVGFLQFFGGFLQINDVDVAAGSKDVLGHLGVPAAGLMPKMDTGFEQSFHGNRSHRRVLYQKGSRKSFGLSIACGAQPLRRRRASAAP